MFWGQNSKPLRRIAAALLLSSVGTAAAAEVLVVRATGPSAKSYRAGMKLADTARISLKANDTLVLLDGRGTRTLRGPGDFSPGAAPQASTRGMVTASASGAGARRARIGAIRGVNDVPPNYWLVNVEKSSTVCLADPSSVTLWRPDPSSSKTLIVTRTRDGSTQEVEWAPKQSTLAWPSELAVSEGENYRLEWKGAAKPTDIKFRTLPDDPGGLEDTAASFIENGCQAQLELLIDTIQARPEPAAPAG